MQCWKLFIEMRSCTLDTTAEHLCYIDAHKVKQFRSHMHKIMLDMMMNVVNC